VRGKETEKNFLKPQGGGRQGGGAAPRRAGTNRGELCLWSGERGRSREDKERPARRSESAGGKGQKRWQHNNSKQVNTKESHDQVGREFSKGETVS